MITGSFGSRGALLMALLRGLRGTPLGLGLVRFYIKLDEFFSEINKFFQLDRIEAERSRGSRQMFFNGNWDAC